MWICLNRRYLAAHRSHRNRAVRCVFGFYSPQAKVSGNSGRFRRRRSNTEGRSTGAGAGERANRIASGDATRPGWAADLAHGVVVLHASLIHPAQGHARSLGAYAEPNPRLSLAPVPWLPGQTRMLEEVADVVCPRESLMPPPGSHCTSAQSLGGVSGVGHADR